MKVKVNPESTQQRRFRHGLQLFKATAYSPDLNEWPAVVTEWDHNQLGTLITVAVDFDEEKYMEEVIGSGDVDNWVYSALKEKGIRLSNIAAYLRARQERRPVPQLAP